METYKGFVLFCLIIFVVLVFIFQFLIGIKTVCLSGIIIGIFSFILYAFSVTFYYYHKRQKLKRTKTKGRP